MALSVIQHHHHAGHGADGCAQRKRKRDHARGVHAHQAGDIGVLLGGAHRAAHAAGFHKPQQRRHDRARQHENERLRGGDLRAAEFYFSRFNNLRQRQILLAPHQRRGILNQYRYADAGN